MHKLLFSLSILLVLIAACSQGSHFSKIGTTGSSSIPPGYCRIKGTIFRIDSTLDTNDNSPCSKAPCIALVRVDSVLGYGAGFGSINTGAEINLKFAFTLGPTTKELFPNLSDRLPGLDLSSSFIADIKRINSINNTGAENKKIFLVYGYTKL